MALLMKTTVIGIPIWAVLTISARPIDAEVTVALITDHDRIGVCRLVTDSDRRRPAVRSLGVADVEVVVAEDRAAHRRDEDRAVLDVELVDRLSKEFLHDPVPATRTVRRRVRVDALRPFVTLELSVEDRGRHQRSFPSEITCSTISACEGSTPPIRRTEVIRGGACTPAWLNARRISSSS